MTEYTDMDLIHKATRDFYFAPPEVAALPRSRWESLQTRPTLSQLPELCQKVETELKAQIGRINALYAAETRDGPVPLAVFRNDKATPEIPPANRLVYLQNLKGLGDLLNWQLTTPDVGLMMVATPKVFGIGVSLYYQLRGSRYYHTMSLLHDPSLMSIVDGKAARDVTAALNTIQRGRDSVYPNSLCASMFEELRHPLAPHGQPLPDQLKVQGVLTMDVVAGMADYPNRHTISVIREWLQNPSSLFGKACPKFIAYDYQTNTGFRCGAKNRAKLKSSEVMDNIDYFRSTRLGQLAVLEHFNFSTVKGMSFSWSPLSSLSVDYLRENIDLIRSSLRLVSKEPEHLVSLRKQYPSKTEQAKSYFAKFPYLCEGMIVGANFLSIDGRVDMQLAINSSSALDVLPVSADHS